MKVIVEWTYTTPKKLETVFRSDALPLGDALILSDDLERTGRTKHLQFLDDTGTTWNLKELRKLEKDIEYEPQDILCYFDGSYDAQSGEGGLGAVIYYKLGKEDYRIRVNQKIDEMDSNNEAEYAAFWFLVRELEELGVKRQRVLFKGDSQVVLNQLSGEWPCYEETFAKWLDRIEEKLKHMGVVPEYEAVSRKANTEADHLAGQGLQGIAIRSSIKLNS
ncbi:reverse transcriptase-like protein [Bacillus lacus]|uniref:Reverse transcriptase-like protein n=1 Tax=Metabacillus lacus TaxID=1983721 RepID=A0A7X2LVZ9_9BACI|nr:ribonuclease H family protein [Metabacillus lacus]MRX70925.1 reverse transcriptase-like protein [Metabacillus lacus]